ncbi:hypothetical protein SDC9_189933 [bioreactor metagenome]|uniref:Uncharacterized protein n=1 Tax=bioreactor metagenome TaxID=1076179 RepID=A0A645HUX3_9ZZZZ
MMWQYRFAIPSGIKIVFMYRWMEYQRYFLKTDYGGRIGEALAGLAWYRAIAFLLEHIR